MTGVAATWLGILLAYDSYYWGAAHQGLPVSFFIVAVIFAAYLLTGLPGRRTAARPGQTAAQAPGADPRPGHRMNPGQDRHGGKEHACSRAS